MNFKEMNIDDIYLNGTTHLANKELGIALECLTYCADHNHLPSHLLLGDLYDAYRAGMMYFYGEGVEQDYQEAF